VPTYDYQCRSCGTTYEVIHSMLEDGPTTCERCGGQLRRVLFPSGIIFKGSGFYSTDSRAGSGSRREASTPPGKEGSTSASEAGSGESSGKSDVDKGTTPKTESERS
jgi:putative FmdB family regulatory protein